MGRLADEEGPDLAVGEQCSAALGENINRRRRFGVLGVEVVQEPGDGAGVFRGGGAYGGQLEGVNRLTNSSAVSATSRQPPSIVSEWPRFGIFLISVTAELRFCFL